MWLSPLFERFVENSPVTVIVRTLMEVILAEAKLDNLFEQTAVKMVMPKNGLSCHWS